MGVLGQAFTPPLPAVGDPNWGTTINAALIELIARVSTLIDASSIALSTADVIHGIRTEQIGAAAGQSGGATWTKGTGATGGYWLGAAAADTVEYPIRMAKNERVRALRVSGRSTGTAWTARLWVVDITTLARTQVGTTITSGVATSIEVLSMAGLGTGVVLAANQSLVVEWTAGAAASRSIGYEVDFDRAVAT